MKNWLLANDFIIPVKLEPIIILMLSPPPKEPTNFSLKYEMSNDAELRMWWKMKKWKCSDLGPVIPGQPRVKGRSVSGFGLFWICVPGTVLKRGALEPTAACFSPWLQMPGILSKWLWSSFTQAWWLACFTAASCFGYRHTFSSLVCVRVCAQVCVTLALCELFSSFGLRQYIILDIKSFLYPFHFYILCKCHHLSCAHLN